MTVKTAARPFSIALAAALALGVLGSGTGSASAFGTDDSCPANDGKNLIVSDAAVIYGTPASDHICGGPSANIIIGGNLDDDIWAGGGNDIIIGGHGVDQIDGGSGNDFLRGGTNRDELYGGYSGTDTVSFADMTPTNGVAGISIDLSSGVANAGGQLDNLFQLDNVVGSPMNDTITAPGGAATTIQGGEGDDTLRGTGGNDGLWGDGGADACTNDGVSVACNDGAGSHRPATAYAFAENRGGRDFGVVALGAEGTVNDNLGVTRNGANLRVTSAGGALAAGTGCSTVNSTTVDCAMASAQYVVMSGGAGNDTLTTGNGLVNGPGTIDVNGETGNDAITGGSDGEIQYTGEGGVDTLIGNGGADALISEGDPVGSGGDNLNSGDGDDQLVTDNACAGHTLAGGAGTDILGFARQTSSGVHAALADSGVAQQAWSIDAVDNEVPGCARSTVSPGSGEIIEGTNENDVLSGNSGPNTVWGRKGNDTLFGGGGSDEIRGHEGDDVIWGGANADELHGGDDWDDLHADDDGSTADSVIDCGAGNDPGARRGPNDPAGIDCNDPIPTNTYLTLGRRLNGQPGWVSVSGNVQRGSGDPIGGYVNVNFEKLENGTWNYKFTEQRTLSNGYYEVNDRSVGVGQWRVQAVFPAGQWHYAGSTSPGYVSFGIGSGYRLIAKHSNKCMSLSGNVNANGTGIIQWACSGAPNPNDGQVFTLAPMGGSDFQLRINSTGSGKCVDVSGVSQANGATLQAWDCLGAGQTNQIWTKIPIAGDPDYAAYAAKHSGKCADVLGVSQNNGAQIGQWDCVWGNNQRWRLDPIG